MDQGLLDDDEIPLEAIRKLDESAFVALLDRYYPAMLRLAMVYVSDQSAAEDVVQDSWLAILNGLEKFEGRSSLRTWIFSILVNRARSFGTRESRWVSLPPDFRTVDPAGSPARRSLEELLGDSRPPAESPDDWILSAELRERIEGAIAELPDAQREVITLRDIDGWSAREVCNVLKLTETNQRVLLHRARVHVRGEIASYLEDDNETAAIRPDEL